jgi:hypothetical protein
MMRNIVRMTRIIVAASARHRRIVARVIVASFALSPGKAGTAGGPGGRS